MLDAGADRENDWWVQNDIIRISYGARSLMTLGIGGGQMRQSTFIVMLDQTRIIMDCVLSASQHRATWCWTCWKLVGVL